MWILNICVFSSTSETGALILYFSKLILGIQKTEKHCKYFFFFTKISCQSEESPISKQSPLFSPTPPILEKDISSPPLLSNYRTQSPPLIKEVGFELWVFSENYLLVLCSRYINVLLPWLFYKLNGVILNLTKSHFLTKESFFPKLVWFIEN